MPRYYVEHDGRVLVRRSDGAITLPEAVDVPVEAYTRRTLRGTEVIFAQAELDRHPEDWPRKDDLAHDPDAEPLLHAAINASLFRPVVGVVVTHGKEILLVKPSRGVARGHWTLPGGFVNFFEDPSEAAYREVREETGLTIEDLELVGTVTYRHPATPYPILGLGYTANAASRQVTPRQGEIADTRWTRPREALDGAGGIAQAVLDVLLEEPR